MQESFRYNPSAPVFVPSQQNSNAASPTTTSADQSTHAPATDVSHIEDFFDNVLHLEDNMYSSGYAQGVQDGSRAGRIEGRVFGLEKGFEKFASLGRLHGRAAVWGSRMYDQSVAPVISSPDADPNLHSHYPASDPASANAAAFNNNPWALPPLPSNDRLNRNIHLVYHMTDPHTFDTANTEEAVADFDDRFKRAGAKAKIIERSVGADRETKKGNRKGKGPNKKGKKMRLVGENKGKEDSMEDFKGGKMLS
ncbi:hypothetical protein M011DRAFT_405858 [Sporormia fimetaria CBS 119925]|uniref:Essential protein Yae1 N-terminal domain-containing protein n=1 Tax=Sporormia fimetaria CBS 119925 TaxID=1340428 RepID=A0A6A6V4Y5_9PLEO|nr:hypothetical protein M011DRAFT_405858 [Sporormia fimetaria CBS 119925]